MGAGGVTTEHKPQQAPVKAGTRIVWKFAVPHPTDTGRAFIDLPQNAEILSAGLQDDAMYVWALVDPLNDNEIRRLIVANTGMEVPGFPVDARFLGTFTSSNDIVWHVWDGDA